MNAMTVAVETIRRNFLFQLYKYYVIDSILIIKRAGFKALIRQRGMKFFYVIIAYYLVRDTVLYIFLPFCVARGLF
jgi:hypothetical protein